ncbi:MAG: hypothetical protein QM756_15900 [Polyangiaceae bacterium]
MKAVMQALQRLGRAREGAVFLEFFFAFLALLTLFFCVAEFSLMSTAKLLIKHAAMSAARAAAVIRLPNPNTEAPPQAFDFDVYQSSLPPYPFPFYEPKDDRDKAYCEQHWKEDPDGCRKTYYNHTQDWDHRDGEISLAAQLALGPWHGSLIGALSPVSCAPNPDNDPNLDDSCQVTAAYRCIFPLSTQLLCRGGVRMLNARASFPHQGARYKPEFGY